MPVLTVVALLINFGLGVMSERCSFSTSLGYNGRFNSPNYPFKYPNRTSRCWRLDSSSSNYVIHLTASSLKLESCPFCSCDSIEIFDGYSEFSRSLGKYCAGNIDLTSSGRYFYVKFTSDNSRNGDAFTIFYSRRKG
ncbi:tolloid-like protein 1 [Xenia sp. Carnegie-2017]|uniref:tolloid-like protein 1 n=1 Tax=Xenia sp. Carnegie-2017 TaxID=2897299 RepID=UPI001F047D4C|nr:tolloid-like protein 1 [Xenia sp. Carnegie-2017]